jgi:hypothetical protein
MHHRTVEELMTREVVRAPRDMPFKEIVGLLAQNHVTAVTRGRRTGPPHECRVGGRSAAQGVERPRLDESRKRFDVDLAELPSTARRIRAPVAPRAMASERQPALTDRVRHRIEEETLARTGDRRYFGRAPSGPDRSVRR